MHPSISGGTQDSSSSSGMAEWPQLQLSSSQPAPWHAGRTQAASFLFGLLTWEVTFSRQDTYNGVKKGVTEGQRAAIPGEEEG